MPTKGNVKLQKSILIKFKFEGKNYFKKFNTLYDKFVKSYI